MIKKILSVTVAMATILSLLCCMPVNAATKTTPYLYCDFDSVEDAGFFWNGHNTTGEDTLVDGVNGSAGAFQRTAQWNSDYDCGYVHANNLALSPELFSAGVKLSFWFKIDPSVGVLNTSGSGTLVTIMPRFTVNDGDGSGKLLGGWPTATLDKEALNRGEWIYVEMECAANGVFDGYTLTSTDTVGLQLRLNNASNSTTQNWTDTGWIAFAIDELKVEKVVDFYCDFDSVEDDGFFYAGYNKTGEDTIIDGVNGTAGAFQRTAQWNNDYACGYMVPSKLALPAELFSATIRVSFWFKIDPSVGQLNTTGSKLVLIAPKFTVTSDGTSYELGNWTYPTLDYTALNNGEWVYIEMENIAQGKFNGYSLQPTDTVSFQLRLNNASNCLSQNWTDTGWISYAVDELKVERVVDFYRSFDTSADNGFFYVGYNTTGEDTIIDGVNGTTGAFQRTAQWNNDYACGYLVPKKYSLSPELFSENLKLSFWFKIDPSVGVLNTSGSGTLITIIPRFTVDGGDGANNLLGGWSTVTLDQEALNRGEWVYVEMACAANGVFDSYKLTPMDKVAFQFRLNGSSNCLSQNWTDTGRISYAIDELKIEKVVEAAEYEASTTLTSLNNNAVTAAARVLNNSADGEADDVALYIIVYDSNDKMIKVASKPFTVPNTSANALTAVGTQDRLPVTLTADELASAAKIKAFLWSNDGECIPLTGEKFTSIN